MASSRQPCVCCFMPAGAARKNVRPKWSCRDGLRSRRVCPSPVCRVRSHGRNPHTFATWPGARSWRQSCRRLCRSGTNASHLPQVYQGPGQRGHCLVLMPEFDDALHHVAGHIPGVRRERPLGRELDFGRGSFSTEWGRNYRPGPGPATSRRWRRRAKADGRGPRWMRHILQ
jgi:hypothetical protein